MSTENKSLPISIPVEINGRTICIKKLGLGKYTELLDVAHELLQKLFNKAVEEFETESADIAEEMFLANIFIAMRSYQKHIFHLIHIASYDPEIKQYQLSVDEIEDYIGLDEATELINAIMDANKLFKVFENIKKFKANMLEAMKKGMK